ncbi:hypothetical protein WMY93_027166 [Mugilogobius chulae]|uniref:PDZ domain-containing protein n=1 Tax=Mugilogobius chulae TaxID=88201 RepID=A0AAW0N2D5_9GOBI
MDTTAEGDYQQFVPLKHIKEVLLIFFFFFFFFLFLFLLLLFLFFLLFLLLLLLLLFLFLFLLQIFSGCAKEADYSTLGCDSVSRKKTPVLSVVLCLTCVSVSLTEEADYSTLGCDSVSRKKTPVLAAVLRPESRKKPAVLISLPRDFRPVSSIIDVDILPESHRRVRLYKHGQDKPLGFYIRDGSSVRVTPQGLEKDGPGGLAESTGLLAVNDEVLEVNGIEVTGKSLDQCYLSLKVLEVNGIEVTGKSLDQSNDEVLEVNGIEVTGKSLDQCYLSLINSNDEVLEVNGIEVTGKSLDQVTDMMIANSHNLIITVKPANQRNNVVRTREAGTASGSSGRSSDSGASFYGYATNHAPYGPAHIIQNFPEDEPPSDDEEDLVIETETAPELPRYEPHLNLREQLLNSNGTLSSSATLRSSASLGSLNTSATGSAPDRGRQRRSLEEEGTVITL